MQPVPNALPKPGEGAKSPGRRVVLGGKPDLEPPLPVWGDGAQGNEATWPPVQPGDEVT